MKKPVRVFVRFFLISSVLFPGLPLARFQFSRQEARPRNVLLITLDTTRADRIGCYGYKQAKTPNLDSLASRGVRFNEAYSQVPLTLPSHCSLMTGTYPIWHQMHNNGFYYLSQDFLTLAEVLKNKGFLAMARYAKGAHTKHRLQYHLVWNPVLYGLPFLSEEKRQSDGHDRKDDEEAQKCLPARLPEQTLSPLKNKGDDPKDKSDEAHFPS